VGSRFRTHEQVDVDLDSIWNLIAADNVSAATRQIDRIGEGVRNPRARSPCERPEIKRICAVFLSGATLIFYLPLPDGIEVVRVMRGRQDIDTDDMGR
jgi:toxin ParE1/3/4